MPSDVITVSAVVFRDQAGRVLTVRKRGTDRFMLPGGKPEPGETALDAAVREVAEEICVALDPAELRLVGSFTAAAANEPGMRVSGTVFEHDFVEVIQPAAEIAELRWTDPHGDLSDVAPLLAGQILPALQRRRPTQVTIFCGAAIGSDPAYATAAHTLAMHLAGEGIGIVYGGGKVGMMGTVAEAALRAGGTVIGVIPKHLVDDELAHRNVTRLEVVASMHERKLRMAELADAFIALPGGLGTLEELFEAWTWLQLHLHAKPVAVYGTRFWRPLLDLLDHLVESGFVRAADRDSLIVADTPAELLQRIHDWTPPERRWD